MIISMKQSLFIIVLAVLSLGQLGAQGEKELQKAQKYEAAGEQQHKNAIKYYRKAADKGNLEALFKVAENDLVGDRPCEQIKTLEILQKLDEADAYRLSNAYRRCGDMEQSILYLKKAAKENNPKALERLGDAYWCGKGVERDRTEALRLYQLAAEKSTGEEKQQILEKISSFRGILDLLAKSPETITPITTSDTDTLPKTNKEGGIFYFNEQMPVYPGGTEKLVEFLRDEVLYPEKAKMNGVTGTNVVEFVVEKDGCVANVKVKTPFNPICDEESERAVMAMSPWQPGKNEGKLVRCFFEVPITYGH